MENDDEAPEETVGTGERRVRAGQSISSIAEQTGHFWQTLWDHPKNEDVKRARRHPNVLLEGDRVHVPPVRAKTEELATSQVHTFKKKGVPARLRVRFARAGHPQADVPFRVMIDNREETGALDGDGLLDLPISPLARKATVVLGEGAEAEVYELRIGGLDPEDSRSGVRQRLLNLGYEPDDDSEQALTLALIAFQRDHPDTTVTGELDDATREALFATQQSGSGTLPRGAS